MSLAFSYNNWNAAIHIKTVNILSYTELFEMIVGF